MAVWPGLAIVAAAIMELCVQAAGSAALFLVRTLAAAGRFLPPAGQQWSKDISQVCGLAGPGVRSRERGVREPNP